MQCLRMICRNTTTKYTLPAISQYQVKTEHGTGYRDFTQVNSSRFNLSHYGMENPQTLQGSCRFCSTSATGVVQKQLQDAGILKRVLKKVGLAPSEKTRLQIASRLLYETAADKVDYLSFFRDFNMPNTFNSWFLVTELHVWMLLMRAMAEGSESGENGRFLRNGIVEAMWGDVNTRAKKLGAMNPSRIRKQIEELSEQFQAALITYDEGACLDDRVLASALWRRFFVMECDDIEKIERLVKYVRIHIQMLENLPKDDFVLKPKIPWTPLKDVTV